MSRSLRRKRLASVTLALGTFGVVVLSAAPAHAEIATNTLGCEGSAEITGGDGAIYRIDANDESAVVPRQGTASYSGRVATTTHDHRGEVRLALGSFDVVVGSWGPTANASGANSAQGVVDLPSFLEQVPAGQYRLSGFHQGAEGRCDGEVTVEVQGGAFANAAGMAGIAGTVIAAAFLAYAARPRLRQGVAGGRGSTGQR
ncbi:MAG: hypothetical protein ACRD0Q_10210 [Acidimicrobiales bacterium]